MSLIYRDYHSFSCVQQICNACQVGESLLSAFAERNNCTKNRLVVEAFLAEQFGEKCVQRMCAAHLLPIQQVSDWFVHAIIDLPDSEFIDLIKSLPAGDQFVMGDIPQISSFDEVQNVSTIVSRTGECYRFEQMGSMLENAWGGRRAHYARIKYGENHAKFAAMMGLIDLRKDTQNQYIISRNALGVSFFLMEDVKARKILIQRLMFRCRMFRNMFCWTDPEKRHSVEAGLSILKQSTRQRRFRTLRALARAYNLLGEGVRNFPEEATSWLEI